MSFDRSWRIRKQFADFINAFLEPTVEGYQQRKELQETSDMTRVEIKAKHPVSGKAKQTKKAFKTCLKEVILELLSDGDDQVAIEGISVLIEYDYLF